MDSFGKAFDEVAAEIKKRYDAVNFLSGTPLPSTGVCEIPDGLSSVIATCFSASTRKEELRDVKVSVVCTNLEFASRWGRYSENEWDVSLFKEPQSFTPDSLRKFSSALSPVSSSILVGPAEKNTEPLILGIVHLKSWTRPRYPHDLIQPIHDKALRITIQGPASLRFDNLACIFGDLIDLQLVFRGDLPFLSPALQALLHLDKYSWKTANEIVATIGQALFVDPDNPEFKLFNPDSGSFDWFDFNDIYRSVLLSIFRGRQTTPEKADPGDFEHGL